jgi:hypothetical protein
MMKIQVVRCDGSIEVINLVGTMTAHEPGTELEYPRNQSPLSVSATGMDYFFREDGRYDGWGMGVSIPIPEDHHSSELPPEAREFIQAIENDREILPPEAPQ